ncbi:MAG: VOC family protein [Oscillospiraceae bacterium]
MTFKMTHQNFNVFDMEKSIKFYEEALGLRVLRRRRADDSSYEICHMGNDAAQFDLELTWMKQYDRPYDLGDCEFHLGFSVDDFDAAYEKHKQMGCIVFENMGMGKGLYFITDPDGYWIEITHSKDKK